MNPASDNQVGERRQRDALSLDRQLHDGAAHGVGKHVVAEDLALVRAWRDVAHDQVGSRPRQRLELVDIMKERTRVARPQLGIVLKLRGTLGQALEHLDTPFEIARHLAAGVRGDQRRAVLNDTRFLDGQGAPQHEHGDENGKPDDDRGRAAQRLLLIRAAQKPVDQQHGRERDEHQRIDAFAAGHQQPFRPDRRRREGAEQHQQCKCQCGRRELRHQNLAPWVFCLRLKQHQCRAKNDEHQRRSTPMSL